MDFIRKSTGNNKCIKIAINKIGKKPS
jgi:hypothetical protein